MSDKHQIGYSLSLWETLKEYNEETKWFEPTKNKKVEVAQMLSEELSDDEEVKSLLIDKLFGYKDNIKEMIMRSDYCDIPSYHKESLEKDQKIADLEAKLAESENSLKCTIEHYEKYCAELKSQNVMLYASAFNLTQHNQDKISFAIEQLEKVLKTLEEQQFFKKEDTAYCVHPAQIAEYISNQIKQLKEMK